MTNDRELSGFSRAAMVMVMLFTSAVFVLAINQTAGLIVLTLAPIAAVVQMIGYPRPVEAVGERIG